jgi:hypothetical protein
MKPMITKKDKEMFNYFLSDEKSKNIKFDLIYNKNLKNLKFNIFFYGDNIFSEVPFFKNHHGIIKLSFTTLINFEKFAYL